MTHEQAKALGFAGWCSHTPNVPCPRPAGYYCATCDGPIARLAAKP